MKIIDQSHEILYVTSPKLIETAGRVAYKSEDRITDESHHAFIRSINEKKHGAVLEHSMLSVRFITDRGVTHEIVRHRLASFTQESTRYCNYAKDKFGNELTFIRPVWVYASWITENNTPTFKTDCQLAYWLEAMKQSEQFYLKLIKEGWSPQQARSVLPNSLKTEIVVTTNFREWQHIFSLRAISKAAHPQMRELMLGLYEEVRYMLPDVFEMGEAEE